MEARPNPPNKFPKPVIFHLYMWYFNYFQEKYGEKTITLMQVGGFYECYGVDNDKMKMGMAKEIGALLHIEVTRRNKEVRQNSIENYLMAGFPLAALSKYIDILMDGQYTVVVIDQEGTAKDKENVKDLCPRHIAEIYSPGTYLDNDQYQHLDDNKYLVQIHLEGYQRTKKDQHLRVNYQPMVIGLAAIDVTTGESDVYEVSNNLDDSNFALDEIYRYLQTHQPKEILLTTNNLEMTQQDLESYLDLQGSCQIRCQVSYNEVPKNYYKLSYQKQCLEKIFPNRGNMLGVIEYLNLEKSPSALLAYLLLLQFTYEHNEILVQNLKRPKTWENESHLLLANNAISQLDLANHNRNKLGSVVNLLNMTSTSMGRRLFRQRLLNPISNPIKINQRYQKVDQLLENNFWQEVELKLNGMLDLDRLHRRIEMSILSPNGLNLLWGSYEQVNDLLEILPDEYLPYNNFRTDFEQYTKYLKDTLDFDETCRYVKIDDIKDNIFKHGFNKRLDELSNDIRRYDRYLKVMIQKMSALIEDKKGTSVVNMKYNDSVGYYLGVTQIRFKKFLEGIKKYDGGELNYQVEDRKFKINEHTFRILKNNKDRTCHVTSDEVIEISNELDAKVKALQQEIVVVYRDFFENLQKQYNSLFENMSRMIGEVDTYKSCAKSSVKFGYCRPSVIPKTDSFIHAVNFRHPLVERINQHTDYVPHSIQLGKPTDDLNLPNVPDMDGLLLYGLNASGKSTCMKAMGINLVMAQAGMYVAAESFTYAPYSKILTRILSNDNIFKGLSSFAVEMSELRGIIARADNSSLILGDEICHGTETISGVSIVASSLQRLSDRKAHYIFATHLHQLTDLELVKGLPRLGVYHMHVEYIPKTHQLLYYRDLREGPGNPLYGIEVARAMDLDEDFLTLANKIRQEMMDQSPDLVPHHTSRYNANVYVNNCLLCETAKAQDTHHIKFQCTADSNGMIGAMHKHEAKNLVPLCKECHVKVHQGLIEVRGYLETSSGLLLDYTVKQKTPRLSLKRKQAITSQKISY